MVAQGPRLNQSAPRARCPGIPLTATGPPGSRRPLPLPAWSGPAAPQLPRAFPVLRRVCSRLPGTHTPLPRSRLCAQRRCPAGSGTAGAARPVPPGTGQGEREGRGLRGRPEHPPGAERRHSGLRPGPGAPAAGDAWPWVDPGPGAPRAAGGAGCRAGPWWRPGGRRRRARAAPLSPAPAARAPQCWRHKASRERDVTTRVSLSRAEPAPEPALPRSNPPPLHVTLRRAARPLDGASA